MSGKRGRPTQSRLGRKQGFEIQLTPEEVTRLVREYGSVQRAVRAFVASLDAPEPEPSPATPSEQKSATLCPRCLRIGLPSCAACRGASS